LLLGHVRMNGTILIPATRSALRHGCSSSSLTPKSPSERSQTLFEFQESFKRRKFIGMAQTSPDKDRDDHLVVARRPPRKTKSAPAARLSHRPIASFARKRSLKADVNHARVRHQIVPVVTNVSPSIRNANTFMFDAGSINCGRNARKNKATFGFSTFVTTPCRKAAALVRRRKVAGKLKCFRRSRSILIPRKISKRPRAI
jgi:hypothetical protein